MSTLFARLVSVSQFKWPESQGHFFTTVARHVKTLTSSNLCWWALSTVQKAGLAPGKLEILRYQKTAMQKKRRDICKKDVFFGVYIFRFGGEISEKPCRPRSLHQRSLPHPFQVQLRPWSLVLWHVTECGCPWYWELGDLSKVPICRFVSVGCCWDCWVWNRWLGEKNSWNSLEIVQDLQHLFTCLYFARSGQQHWDTVSFEAPNIWSLWNCGSFPAPVVYFECVICFHVLYLKFWPARLLSSDLTTSDWIHLNFWFPSRWLTLSFATNDPH